MNFNDYYIDLEYDEYIKHYMYLESFLYYDPFEKSQVMWEKGNGNYLGYNNEYDTYWNKSLIFKL